MPERAQSENARKVQTQLASDLKAKFGQILDAVIDQRRDSLGQDFDAFVARLQEVFRQRREGARGGSPVRDLLAEKLFPRLKTTFRQLFDQGSWIDPLKCAESLVGMLTTTDTCADFAAAVERIAEESGRSAAGGASAAGSAAGGQAFSFAGLTDFISLEEVLQLLGAGKHTGCLTLENPAQRIEVYLNNGRLAFLNPRTLLRRVFATRDALGCREIPERLLQAAAKAMEKSGTPIAVSLHLGGFIREAEVREACKVLGSEVLFEFLQEPQPATFCYRRLVDLPDFVTKHDLRLGITPFLLDSSRRLDDMAGMRKAFPDPDQAIRMQADAFARLGDLNLNPIEIKMLAQLNEGASVRKIAQRVGVPLYDAYQAVVRFAREGVVTPPGGVKVLIGVAASAQENLQSAFEALDANDDDREMSNALDKAFGRDDVSKSPRRGGES